MINTSLNDYMNETDSRSLVDEKISANNMLIDNNISNSISSALSNYTNTTTLESLYSKKSDLQNEVNSLSNLISTKETSLESKVTELSRNVNNNFVQLNGSTMSGLLTNNTGFKSGDMLYKDTIKFKDKDILKVNYIENNTSLNFSDKSYTIVNIHASNKLVFKNSI